MPDKADAPTRCFVGLWPDPDAATRLDAVAAQLQRQLPQARRVPRTNLHLTLAFIGQLEAEPAARVAARLTAVRSEPFAWPIDHVGSFDGARVAWAGGPLVAPLAGLADTVRSLLTAESVTYDRKAFVPHVTLLRKLPRTTSGLAQPIDPPIAWMGVVPVLLQSVSGHYVALAPGT